MTAALRGYIRRSGASGGLGLMIVGTVTLAALLAPIIAPHDPVSIDLAVSLEGPGNTYLLGTDQAGRDILSRLIWGARVSLQVGVLAVAVGLLLGLAMGLVSAFYSGTIIEQAIMRTVDALASIPLLIWAIALVGILGVKPIDLGFIEVPNEFKLIVMIGVLYAPNLARVTYAVALGESQSDYVKARRVQGASDAAIIFGDILPNCLSPVVVQATLLIAAGIIIEASLSFIGLGVQPPQPSWGGMLSDARSYLYSGEWWLFVFPGIAISLTVIGFNLLGDALRDALDPRRQTANVVG